MESDVLEAIINAADIYKIPHKNMAYAISVALNSLARKRTGSYGIEKQRLTALADEFEEFA